MVQNYIVVKGTKYYYYDSYTNYNSAKSTALYYRKEHGSRYFIIKSNDGFWFPRNRYLLYMNNVKRLL